MKKYKKRICSTGFAAFNKNRKVLPSSVLWLGCTHLRRVITTPRCSLSSPYFPLQNRVLEYLSTGASRSQSSLEFLVRPIKGELWIEYLDGGTQDS